MQLVIYVSGQNVLEISTEMHLNSIIVITISIEKKCRNICSLNIRNTNGILFCSKQINWHLPSPRLMEWDNAEAVLQALV